MKVHFIAIGGSVMHQLAISLLLKGYQVSGSDDEIFEPAKTNLIDNGIMPPGLGWRPEKITADLDAVILGMHARNDNPELVKAKKFGLKIYSFPEYIYEQSRDKKRVAVGGSHGKTTTTSMIMHTLKKANFSFDYMVGAKLEGFPQSVQLTDAQVIVCEADEYPASAIEKRPKFHFLFPYIAVLTGIAWDHINVFPTFDFYKEQFIIFINKIENDGYLIFNETDPILSKLVNDHRRNDLHYIPYGLPTHTIKNGLTTLMLDGESGLITVFGNHNLLNLNAAYLVCKLLGLNARTFLNAISDFTGASKRLEVIYNNHDITIYRDFAHAPSKVKASIEAVRKQFPDRKLIAILELHTYSSLSADFMIEYNGVLDPADKAVVFYSAHALEIKKMPPLNPDLVKAGFNNTELTIINEKNELDQWLKHQDYSNTNLLLMSSGTYDGLDIMGAIKR